MNDQKIKNLLDFIYFELQKRPALKIGGVSFAKKDTKNPSGTIEMSCDDDSFLGNKIKQYLERQEPETLDKLLREAN